ncbi:hypothetical protein EV361DRAFT_906381 [Lentinula raphanica]|nr:hypothetical protein EV361DRAFT_906381 [Lentinula raphanica]
MRRSTNTLLQITSEIPDDGFRIVNSIQLSRRQTGRNPKSYTFDPDLVPIFWAIKDQIPEWDKDADKTHTWKDFRTKRNSGHSFIEAIQMHRPCQVRSKLFNFGYKVWRSRHSSRPTVTTQSGDAAAPATERPPSTPAKQIHPTAPASPDEIFHATKNTVTPTKWDSDVWHSLNWDEFLKTSSGKIFARIRDYYESAQFRKQLDELGREDFASVKKQMPKEGQLDDWKSNALFQHIQCPDLDMLVDHRSVFDSRRQELLSDEIQWFSDYSPSDPEQLWFSFKSDAAIPSRTLLASPGHVERYPFCPIPSPSSVPVAASCASHIFPDVGTDTTGLGTVLWY